MKSCRTLIVMATLSIALGLSACVSIVAPPARVEFREDFDFSSVRIIAFTEQRSDVGDDDLNEKFSARIRTGLGQNLEDKGMSVTDTRSQARLLLRWQLLAEDRTDVQASKSNSYYMCWRCGSSITDIRVKKYTRGTFVVEFVDPASGSSVWQAVMYGRLTPERSLRDQEALIDAACREILSNFPPKIKLL
jgi:hypothetical protein